MPTPQKKVKTNRVLIIILSVGILGLIGVVIYMWVYFHAIQQAQNKVLLQLHADSVYKTKQTNTILSTQYKELKRTRENISLLAQKQKQLEKTQKLPMTIPELVRQWSPLVAKITCKFNAENVHDRKWGTIGITPKTEYKTGSGFLMSLTGATGTLPYIGVITNKHVLRGHNGFSGASECLVDVSGSVYVVTAGRDIQDALSGKGDVVEYINGEYHLVSKIDAGFIIISDAKKDIIQYAQTPALCTTQPRIGDEIVVLGFPAVGSDSGITATEGIISGIEGNYFVTSAKIEQGNSGGAAFLVKENCYFGIPTFVRSGELESLARILSVKAFFGK